MLRFIHTADWHLGQTFHNYDRTAEHAAFLDHLLAVLAERRPDALLMAGDVFDVVNPSADSQRLYYSFLARLHAAVPGLRVVITAGNHDAAARLEAPSELLGALDIRVVGTVARTPDGEIDPAKFLVPLHDRSGTVRAIALAVPFLRQADVPVVPDATNAYTAGVRELYARVTAAATALRDSKHPGAALVALGHCHMQAAETTSDSERSIVIGGEEALLPDTFPPSIAYVALGHLHKPQDALDGGRIRYCGSPIPLSFSEQPYKHRVLEVTLGDDNAVAAVESIPVPRSVELLRVPARKAATTDEVIAQLTQIELPADLPRERHPFLEVRILELAPEPDRRHRIEKALEGRPLRLASIKVEHPARDGSQEAFGDTPSASLDKLDPAALFVDAYQEEYAAPPPPDLLAALAGILRAAPEASDASSR